MVNLFFTSDNLHSLPLLALTWEKCDYQRNICTRHARLDFNLGGLFLKC